MLTGKEEAMNWVAVVGKNRKVLVASSSHFYISEKKSSLLFFFFLHTQWKKPTALLEFVCPVKRSIAPVTLLQLTLSWVIETAIGPFNFYKWDFFNCESTLKARKDIVKVQSNSSI